MAVIDLAINQIITSIPLQDNSVPFSIAITPDGSRVYVANQGTLYAVKVIDTSSNTVIGSLPAGSFPAEIAITPIFLF